MLLAILLDVFRNNNFCVFPALQSLYVVVVFLLTKFAFSPRADIQVAMFSCYGHSVCFAYMSEQARAVNQWSHCQVYHCYTPALAHMGTHVTTLIDLIHKSHNAPVLYPTMHHSEQKFTHFCSEWCIVGYGTGASWDLWHWSVLWGLILMPLSIPPNPLCSLI